MGRGFQYLLDALPGIALGAAVCFSVTSVFALPLLVGAALGALVFVRVFASLVRLPPVGASPGFLPAALEFEEEAELLLVEPVATPSAGQRVVPLFRQAPTPGEMHEAIERHLAGRAHDAPAAPAAPAPDATEELRQALAELRRSAG